MTTRRAREEMDDDLWAALHEDEVIEEGEEGFEELNDDFVVQADRTAELLALPRRTRPYPTSSGEVDGRGGRRADDEADAVESAAAGRQSASTLSRSSSRATMTRRRRTPEPATGEDHAAAVRRPAAVAVRRACQPIQRDVPKRRRGGRGGRGGRRRCLRRARTHEGRPNGR